MEGQMLDQVGETAVRQTLVNETHPEHEPGRHRAGTGHNKGGKPADLGLPEIG
jgi:hypothetical protein